MTPDSAHSRIEWIDTAKGLGIILVILGHIGFGRFGYWIYSFHIPLFFFISGYLIKYDIPFRVFLKKRFHSLLVPYILVVVLFYIPDFYLGNDYAGTSLGSFLTEFIIQKRFKYVWFLSCLFVLDIFYFIVLKNIHSDLFLVLLTFGFSVIWYALRNEAAVWNIDAALFASPFFLFGYMFRKYCTAVYSKKKNFLLSAVFFVINIIFVFFNLKICGKTLDIFILEYGCVPVTYLSAFSGIASVVFFSKALSPKPLTYVGKNSLIYYCVHLSLAMPAALVTLNSLGYMYTGGIPGLMYKFVYFVLIFSYSTVFVLLIRWVKNGISAKKNMG